MGEEFVQVFHPRLEIYQSLYTCAYQVMLRVPLIVGAGLGS